MYLSVDCDTRWSVEHYVRSCCEREGRRLAEDEVAALAASVAVGIGHELLDTASAWRPTAASHVAAVPPAAAEGDWVLDVLERRLRAVGFQPPELDALYQQVSEVAERQDRRALVARMALEV